MNSQPTPPEDVASLYRRAFDEYGARALWPAPGQATDLGGCLGDYRSTAHGWTQTRRIDRSTVPRPSV